MTVVGCATVPSRREDATPTPLPTPIVPTKPTYEVQRGEVVRKLAFTGRVAPVVEEELFFRTSGYVGSVYVSRGDDVQAGDVLAELEVRDLKNQLAQAEASLRSAQSSNEQRTTEAEIDLRTAELRLASIKADDPTPRVTTAEVALERARDRLRDAQQAYEDAWDPGREWELNIEPNRQALEAEREAAERALQEARRSLRVAEAAHQEALQAQEIHRYNVQIQEQAVSLARLRLEKLESGLDVEEIRLNVQRLRDQLSDARLVAPFDGRVLMARIDEGRAVEAHATVMTVGDLGALELSASVATRQMEDLIEGMPVTCTSIAHPGAEIEGHIRRLPYPYGGGGGLTQEGQDEDESVRVALETTLDASDIELGDMLRATVVLERKEGVLWLPPEAIRTFEGRDFVVVQEGEGQRRVDVELGVEGDDRVEIQEGLEEGQVVIGL
jgi:RND family efflux transporter MFP subunit